MWYILALNCTASYQVNRHLPNLKRWSDLLINRQHTQNIRTDKVHPSTRKDWKHSPYVISEHNSSVNCCLSEAKKWEEQGWCVRWRKKMQWNTALTLMATKELSLLRLGFNEVADKMSRQRVWRLNPPLSTEHINEKSGRKNFSTLPTRQPQLWSKRNTYALQMLFQHRG